MPPLQKIDFAKDREAEFMLWIVDQLHQTEGDRVELVRKWENSLIQARAQMPDGDADWPWPGAPDIEFPLTDIHFQPVYADFMQTFHAPTDYWTPKALRPDTVQYESPLREGMTLLDRRFLNMKRVNRSAFMDNTVLGTAIYKNHWHSERKPVRRYNSAGQIEDQLRILSQPRIEHVPIQRFWLPADAWDIDPDVQGGARWVAQEFHLTRGQLEVWARGAGNMPGFNRDALEKVLTWDTQEERPVENEVREEDDYKPFEDRKIRLFEVHARFDVNDDGIDEDVVAIVHKEAMQLLRAIYTPFAHGSRPFHKINYLPFFGFYGRGIAEQDEWAQDMATILFNAQMHNVLLANTRMYDVPEGANITPDEPIYPGKIWYSGPDEQVREVRMADIYQSLPQVIGQLMQFAEMRTGVSEIRQGNLTGLPSRTPATSLMSILREGNKRFDMVLSHKRDVHSEMGVRMLQNLSQHIREDPIRWQQFFLRGLGEEDAALVLDALTQEDVDSIEEAFGVNVTATSAQVNKEVEKQSFIGLMQILTQMGGQLIQLAQVVQQMPPGTPTHEAAASMFVGGVSLLKQLLERFDIQNPDSYLGNLEAIAGALSAQQSGQNAGTAGLVGQGGLGLFGAGAIPPELLNAQQTGALGGF